MNGMKFLLMAASMLLITACDSANRYEPCNDNDDMCKTEGATRCSSDNTAVQTCEKNDKGCFVWTDTDKCSDRAWTCSDAGDKPECVGECINKCDTQDDSRCSGTLIQKCKPGDDGCLDWVDFQDCKDSSQYCDDTGSSAVCSSDCPDPCDTSGMSKCDGDIIETCTVLDENCTSWVFEQDCSSDGGACKFDMGAAWCSSPCAENTDCSEGDYCAKDSCDAATGSCTIMPGGCPEYYSPVCACDGLTYGNDCEAASAGQNIDHPGECDASACETNQDCGNDLYCYKQTCESLEGVCQAKPPMSDCPRTWDPVCGCDGKTYSNDCEAQANGMNIDYRGECEQNNCWSNDMCDEGQYCLFEVCAAETGLCTERPLDCPDVWDPVCGCDGNTYSNDCDAAASGISVDHKGECNSTHCLGNDMCPPEQYCLLPGCGANSGNCVDRPGPCPEVWDPVCACNGITYSNECEAGEAGQTIAHTGECEPDTCWSNDMCNEDQYCRFDGCDAESGTCAVRPSDCPEVWNPVCACDGQTYDNRCVAAQNGESVDYIGECSETKCTESSDCNDWRKYCMKESCDDAEGLCVVKPNPTDCPATWQPVCGCDLQTYPNRCAAAARGQNIDYEGECAEPFTCSSDSDCIDIDFCFFTQCGAESGTCALVPIDCPNYPNPVCGCDGVSYQNACHAAMQRQSVDYEGECH